MQNFDANTPEFQIRRSEIANEFAESTPKNDETHTNTQTHLHRPMMVLLHQKHGQPMSSIHEPTYLSVATTKVISSFQSAVHQLLPLKMCIGFRCEKFTFQVTFEKFVLVCSSC